MPSREAAGYNPAIPKVGEVACLQREVPARESHGARGGEGRIVIEPGHDAWTVGDEACVLLDTGVASYATAS